MSEHLKEKRNDRLFPSFPVERRILRRKKIAARKIMLVEISFKPEEPPKKCNIHLQISDINECGIMIATDTLFPVGTNLNMRLYLHKPVNLEGQVRWNKETVGNNNIMGIQFPETSEVNRIGVSELLAWAEPYVEKRTHKVKKIIPFISELEETRNEFNAYVVLISPSGMEILHRTDLPEGRDINLIFPLKQGIQPVKVRSRVVLQWKIKVDCEETLFPVRQKIWIEFLEPDVIQKHIQKALIDQ